MQKFIAFIDESDYYRKRTQTLVPLKWMAPETVRDAKYSTKSDVWAFGVFCYEVTSLGMTPYGALGGQELMAELERGYRLPQSATTPANLLVFSFVSFMRVYLTVRVAGMPSCRGAG